MSVLGRRPIKSRGSFWAKALAGWMVRANVSPDSISAGSVLFACAGMVCLLLAQGAPRPLLLVTAAACILLRLLCNLLDGMVAVEGGRQGLFGDLFNELPDRFSDLILIVPLGYLCGALPFGRELGWCAGVLALATAYLRAFSAAQGCVCFVGPMAKSHRMALEVAGLLLAALSGGRLSAQLFYAVLVLMCLGCVITLLRRGRRLVQHLRGRGCNG